ncbi:MAG: cob(I)yrinic acid a,c-diamide adenosyltransferase [bacterium]
MLFSKESISSVVTALKTSRRARPPRSECAARRVSDIMIPGRVRRKRKKGRTMERGLVQVYTGNGKGKTTAALGLAMRAAGRGLKVAFIQFMKGCDYGELASAARLPNLEILQYGRECFVSRDDPDPRDVELARAGLEKAKDAILSGGYDVVVLDEINVAIDFDLVSLAEALELLKKKSGGTEVVCTGRYAPRALLEAADLVTEMVEVKHPFKRGVKAREGIEH